MALSDVPVGSCMDALAAVMIGVVPQIGIKVLAGAIANVLKVVMAAAKFPLSRPLIDLSPWTALDALALALLDCERVLQTWMPSYHE